MACLIKPLGLPDNSFRSDSRIRIKQISNLQEELDAKVSKKDYDYLLSNIDYLEKHLNLFYCILKEHMGDVMFEIKFDEIKHKYKESSTTKLDGDINNIKFKNVEEF